MKELVRELRDECAELDGFLTTLKPEDWTRQTIFFGWTVADEVMHLHQVDGFGIAALSAPERFPDIVAGVRAGQARGIELSQKMREDYGHLSHQELIETWRSGYQQICDLFDASEPDARLPWFGPPMAASAFVTARQMEVWAHGQDIYDLFRVRRKNSARLRNICELGVRTHGWSFANRKLERPDKPEVRLTAPDGVTWLWNEGQADRISGLAEDFAMVVTQRRHVDDTSLEVVGAGARQWMEIAQCFAGAPQRMPAPGERAVSYA
jgi:uncharacterized protein (TIGR03084 family)